MNGYSEEMQGEPEYVVIDRLTNNLLGEFDHRQHAEEFVHKLAEANNGSYAGLTIVSPGGTTYMTDEDFLASLEDE